MQTDRVTLLIAGKEHSYWEGYEIDSDLMIPADAWSVSLGMSGGQMPPGVMDGASVVVKVGNDTVLTGYVDDIIHSVGKTSHMLTMSGRDLAADLLDCSAPIFDKKMVSLKEVVAAITSEFKYKNIRIDADSTCVWDKVHVEPGDTAWSVLAHAAEANGLWPWFEPDGTLVVGGPKYYIPPVATLILRHNGKGNNILELGKTASHAERYSKITVFSQAHGTEIEPGKNDLHASWNDTGVLRHRPKFVCDNELENTTMCRDRARKLIDDSRVSGFTLTAAVQGHRIVAPGQPSDGQLWKPGQRVQVISEPHGINGVFFLMARKFTRNRMNGTRTVLTLKEDGVWLTTAHPHKNKHRYGKNSFPGQIVDSH